MRILLDTHIFLWFISGDKRLPKRYRESIEGPENDVYLSVASVWEAVIKNQLGKLELPQPADIYLPLQRLAHGISSLSIDEASVSRLSNLPPLHRDPFDRVIVCQAMQYDLSIASVDSLVRAYPVSILSESS